MGLQRVRRDSATSLSFFHFCPHRSERTQKKLTTSVSYLQACLGTGSLTRWFRLLTDFSATWFLYNVIEIWEGHPLLMCSSTCWVAYLCLLFVTPWIVPHQVTLSMGFPRQEYWSWLLFPSSGDLPDPGIKPGSPILQADALPSEPPEGVPMRTWYLQNKEIAKFCN